MPDPVGLDDELDPLGIRILADDEQKMPVDLDCASGKDNVSGRVEADHTLEAGEHVVMLGRFRGRSRATGREFAVELCHVWRVVEGRITWFRNYVDTAALLRALRAPAR